MKKFILMAVFMALYFSASAQADFIVQPYSPDMGDPFQKQTLETVQYNGEEIQIAYGDFNDLLIMSDTSDMSGASDVYYKTTDGVYHSIPAKAFSYVYKVENDNVGNVLIATDQGVFQLTTNGTLTKLIEGITKLIYPRQSGELVYTVEIPSENEDETNMTNVYLLGGTGAVLLFSHQAIISGYGEADSICFFSFSAQYGLGAAVVDDYLFTFNLNTWELLPHAEPYEPANDDSYSDAGGYSPIYEAYGKLYMKGNDVDCDILEWNGAGWTETPLSNQNFKSYVTINNELYIGPFKIDPIDYSYDPIPVLGNQMAWGNLNFFNGEWYIFDAELDRVTIGPVTSDIEYFSDNIEEFMPSSIVKIGEATGINNLFSNVSIYPNPANDVVVVDGMIDIAMYDLMGQSVSFEQNGNSTISVKNLLPGMYILTAKDAISDVKYVAQLLVQH